MKLLFPFLFILVLSLSLKGQTNEEMAIAFIKKLERQQFDSCYSMFDTSMANKFNAAMLEKMWGSIPRYMGEYKGYTTVESMKKDSIDVVAVRCTFEKTKMDLQFSFAENKKIISASSYYSSYIHDMSQDFQPDNLYKNNYVKLRELSISYIIPKKLVSIAGIQKLSVSLNARNLFYFYKTIPNIDAESALGSGSFTEYSFFPSVKTYGFGLNVSF